MSTYVYGAPQYLPIDERHPVLPNSPYNHSKYLAEQLCQFYNRVFDSPVVILRPFNIFGPGQAPHFIVPAILGQLLDDSRQEIQLMDLAPERDYVYVDDVVDALVSSLARPGCEVYNLGTGSSVSVLALAEAVMEAAQRKKPISSKGSVRKNEVTNIVASIQKAHAELGWTPRVDLREGLSRILAEWQP
jgi:nucleoside-diphosphate-sugar epimerase